LHAIGLRYLERKMKHLKLWLLALTCTAWAGAAWAAPDWTRASVVKVDAEKSRIVLKHQHIKSINMEPMTMPFKVEAGVKLAPFKAGDKVRFTVVERNDHLMIDAMEKIK
jgi:Cu/Ag efflux protein CusF